MLKKIVLASDCTLPTSSQKAEIVQRRMQEAIVGAMGGGFDTTRFVPFVLMYEFEALLFSDCSVFANSICQPGLSHHFQSIRDQFNSPEEINDSPITAPSKRILSAFSGYEKILYGNIAALSIGLDRIGAECPNFSVWVDRLRQLGK